MMVTGMLIAEMSLKDILQMEEFILLHFKADRSTGGGVAPFKGQWSCKWKS